MAVKCLFSMIKMNPAHRDSFPLVDTSESHSNITSLHKASFKQDQARTYSPTYPHNKSPPPHTPRTAPRDNAYDKTDRHDANLSRKSNVAYDRNRHVSDRPGVEFPSFYHNRLPRKKFCAVVVIFPLLPDGFVGWVFGLTGV
mmetsp:Transcript_29495/g.54411  ORF Transcript_29495/g.54411 Transcript_29495/m.54411 type:complete len:142 (-) Transcript_29495:846-1271(-)